MNFFSSPLKSFLILMVVGQIGFALFSPRYLTPRYEGRIFATIAVELRGQDDLHKLNEAAHYFGQTIIGWTKFPNFLPQLREKTGLPEGTDLSAHMQERQNIVFTLSSGEPIAQEHLDKAKNYLQNKLTQYNESSSTGFTLSNLDYEILTLTRSYGSGAGMAFILTLILWLAIVYLRKEIKN